MKTLVETLDNINLNFKNPISNINGESRLRDVPGETINPEITFKTLISRLCQYDHYTVSIFGAYLYYTFFNEEDVETVDYDFDLIDCIKMLCELSDVPEVYENLIFDLQSIDKKGEIDINYDFSDASDIAFTSDGTHIVMPDEDIDNTVLVSERVSGVFGAQNMNRRKRKFMDRTRSLSTAEMIRTKAQRKAKAQRLKAKRRRYYNKNKNNINRRAKMYNMAIKKGRHIKKMRWRT